MVLLPFSARAVTPVAKVAPQDPYPVEFVKGAAWRTTEEVMRELESAGFTVVECAQTLTTHAKFSNDAVEEPSPGYDRGGYVGVRARAE